MEIRNLLDHVREAYDSTAKNYASHFLGELEEKRLDRALLNAIAEETRDRRVCDVGTGPGQIARYLADRGAIAVGVDLSSKMVEEASAHHPHLEFQVGNMLDLRFEDGALAAMTAFYSIVHLVRDDLASAFVEWYRVLAPGAPLLLAFHVGREAIHLSEFLDAKVALAWNFFTIDEVASALERVGFVVEARIERRAYPSEHPSTRGYILARRPSA